MPITTLNSQAIPADVIQSSDLDYPLTDFSSTGIDDNATSTAITIDASENVGIGTASPSSLGLLAVGDGATGTKTIAINGSGSSTSVMDIDFRGGGTGGPAGRVRFESSTKDLSFWTGNYASIAQRMTITDSGNVGIGTTPNQQGSTKTFHVQSNNGVTLKLEDGTTEFDIQSVSGVGALVTRAAIPITFYTNSTEKMRIESNGRVGIGTTSPSARLHLLDTSSQMAIFGSTSTSTYVQFRSATTTTRGYIGNGSGLVTGASNSDFIFRSQGDAVIATGGNAERMRIDSSGRVGIGTTSPSEPLSVAGNVTINSAIYRTDTGAGGIRFATAGNIRPVNNAGTSTDLALDIGDPSFRFNDLHLGGDAFVDGAITSSGLTATLTSGYIRIQDLNSVVVSGTDMGGIEWRTGDSNVSGANRITASISAIGDGTFNAADKAPTALTFSTHGTSGASPAERMRIDASGNVGIGSTSPNANIHIVAGNPAILLQSSGAGTDSTLKFLSRNISNVAAYADIIAEGAGHNSTNAPIVFTQGSGQTERMRIDSTGNVKYGENTYSEPKRSYATYETLTYTSATNGSSETETGTVSLPYQAIVPFSIYGSFSGSGANSFQYHGYIHNVYYGASVQIVASDISHSPNIWNAFSFALTGAWNARKLQVTLSNTASYNPAQTGTISVYYHLSV